jgi:hypothetical protein
METDTTPPAESSTRAEMELKIPVDRDCISEVLAADSAQNWALVVETAPTRAP